MSPVRGAFLAVLLAAAATTGAQAQTVIGVAAPMSGPLAPLGVEIAVAVEAAVAEINRTGGVLGDEITVEIADDSCSAEGGEAAAAQLVEAGVVFVVGHLCSAASIAAAPIYAEAGIIQIAPGSPDPRFTDERAGPGTFRLYGRADEQAMVAAAFLAGRPAAETIAVVDDRSVYGRRLAGEVSVAMAEAGRAADLNDFYSVGGEDLPVLVGRLDAAGIDIVFAAGSAEAVAALLREMAAQDYRPLLIGGDTLADQAFIEAAGDGADGTLFLLPPDPAEEVAAADGIAVIEAAGGKANGFALYAYAAVEIWADAAGAVGTTGFAEVADRIATNLFDTALGTAIGFVENGNYAQPGWVIYQWLGGEFSRYQP